MSLDAAASDRKARLAQLASLKRKRSGTETTTSESKIEVGNGETSSRDTDTYVSGRNYDASTRGPKLGFESAPKSSHETVEEEAMRISAAAAQKAAQDEADAEKGIDLFKLQPKKPNWDLKRDLAEKTGVINVRTQNAIARLVRERIESSKREAMRNRSNSAGNGESEEVGLEGNTLVEAVHLREREEEARREEGLGEEEDGIS